MSLRARGRAERFGWVILVLLLTGCGGGRVRATGGSQEVGGDGSTQEVASGRLSNAAVGVDADGVVHAVWVEGETGSTTVMARSRDPDGGWSSAVSLSDPGYDGAIQVMRDPNGRVCVFWDDSTHRLLSCFEREGWSAERSIGQSTIGGYGAAFDADGEPVLVAAGASCCVAFGEVPLSAEGTAQHPAVAVDSEGRIHVAFDQADPPMEPVPPGVIHRVSDDGGATWSEPGVLDPSWITSTASIVADEQGGVHWLAPGGTYRRWDDADGWTEPTEVDGGEGFQAVGLAVDAGGLAVALLLATEGVYLAEQGEDGAFGPPRIVPGTEGSIYEVGEVAVGHDGARHLLLLTGDDTPTLSYVTLG